MVSKTDPRGMKIEMEVDEECPVKQVDVTVPKTDDPTMPVLTFRMWVIGLVSCVLLSFVNQFFWYRTEAISISSISAQIAVVPIGHLMARVLPTRRFFEGSVFEFTMNPGPFNIKEHVLITIFAICGAGTVYATHILSAVKLYYKRKLTFLPAFFIMLTTQVLGFGWAGLFRRYLVEPGEMWWPYNLVQVSLFRALHEKEKRPRGGMTRNQFFLLVMICSFAYYTLPGYLFTMLTSFSWVCWLAPKSVLAHQLGSGRSGLGIGAVGFDWSTISSYLGSPLASPWFATANIAVGFAFFMYVLEPICYWFDVYNAKTFPIYSSSLYTGSGSLYKIPDIVDRKFHLDRTTYGKLGRVHLSTMFALIYGMGFATLSATFVHVLLFNGSDLWKQSKRAFGRKRKMDIHTKLMQRYRKVPTWWFIVLLVLSIAASIFVNNSTSKQALTDIIGSLPKHQQQQFTSENRAAIYNHSFGSRTTSQRASIRVVPPPFDRNTRVVTKRKENQHRHEGRARVQPSREHIIVPLPPVVSVPEENKSG